MKKHQLAAVLRTLLVLALIVVSAPPGMASAQTPSPHAPAAPDQPDTAGSIYLPYVSAPTVAPDFVFVNPLDATTLSGTRTFEVRPLVPGNVTKVVFKAGSEVLGTDDSPNDGFSVYVDATKYAAGPLVLSATATGLDGATLTKSITVTNQPVPPASAVINQQGGSVATAGGNTINLPPGAVPPGTTITVQDKTREQVTQEKGIDWDALGVTFLGAIDVQSTAEFSKPLGVSVAGFANRVQPGQALVTYNLLPDANGDGAGELVAVNGATLAPNNVLVSSPVPDVVVKGISVGTQPLADVSAASANEVISGPPGTVIRIRATGLNLAAAYGNVAIFHSDVDGKSVAVAGAVSPDDTDPTQQVFTTLIPPLAAGSATVTLYNMSTGSTAGPFGVTVTAPGALTGEPTQILDNYAAAGITFLTNLDPTVPGAATYRDQMLAQLTALRTALPQLASDNRSDVQGFLHDAAVVVQNSGILALAAQIQAAGPDKQSPAEKAFLDIYTASLGVLTAIGGAVILVGGGAAAFPILAPVLAGVAIGVAIIKLYQALEDGLNPCGPSLMQRAANSTRGMGGAPPPGGNGCGNVAGGGGATGGLAAASVTASTSGRYNIHIFPRNGGAPLSPFTGVTDDAGYFFLPLISAGEPYRAVAVDSVTGAEVTFDGVGPQLGESTVMAFNFFGALGSRFNINIGDTVQDAQPSSGAGNLEKAGNQDLYVFNATPGQQVYVDLQAVNLPSNAVRWSMEDSSGAVLFNRVMRYTEQAYDPGTYTLSRGGAYTITVNTERNNDTGTYKFTLWNVPEPQQFGISIGDTITNGQPALGAGVIESIGVQDIYTFTAAANQQIYVDLQAVNISGITAYWKLVDSTGAVLFDRSLVYTEQTYDPGTITLARGGVYTLYVNHERTDSIGTYQFKLWPVSSPQSFAINIGDTVKNGQPAAGAGNLESIGVQDIYTFNAPAGKQIYVDLQAVNISGITAYWKLTDSTGAVLFDRSMVYTEQTYDPGTITLARGGEYTLTVNHERTDSIGTYQFKIWSVADPQQFAIAIGDTVKNGQPAAGAGNLEAIGAEDIYTFNAAAGKQIYVDLQAVNLSGITAYWKLTDSTGAVLFDRSMVYTEQTYDPGTITLTRGGQYTIIVNHERTDTTGTYQFKLWNVPAPQTFAINIGDVVSNGQPAAGAGNLESLGVQDIYTFNAAAGAKVYVDLQALNLTGVTTYWKMVDDTGAVIFDRSMVNTAPTYDPGNFTLTRGGQYTITVNHERTDSTGTYQFAVLNQP